MIRWSRFAAAYVLLAVFASVVAVLSRGSPLVHPEPWLVLDSRAAHTYSLFLGLALATVVVLSTRVMVPKVAWARDLHGELRPFARTMTLPWIVTIAVLSAVGEELFFRGLLQPFIGLVPQAVLFGVLHQLPGKSRWAWLVWATCFGLAAGAMFRLTGSLAGPIAAHVLVNAMNLAYLKHHDPTPQRRALGGLLGERGG